MATDTRRRQKQLERRKAKDKARKRALAQRDPRDVAARIERAATAPILHCCTTDVLWNEGMSHVLVNRELPSGNVAFVAFLVDIYCLGVKDVCFNVASRGTYDSMLYGKLIGEHQMVKLTPPEARKLIEGAVEYAGDLGLPPHPDYRKAKAILGDIDGDEHARTDHGLTKCKAPSCVADHGSAVMLCRRSQRSRDHSLLLRRHGGSLSGSISTSQSKLERRSVLVLPTLFRWCYATVLLREVGDGDAAIPPDCPPRFR